MPLNRARCFVLRTHAVGETDKLAVLFAAEEGKVRGWANGARRPRSRFGGALEVGNCVEAHWFEREGRELVTLDRCDLVSSALPLVRDPVRAAALGYLSELVEVFSVEREPQRKLFRLVESCRAALFAERPPLPLAAYFESWLLRLSGLYPRPGVCECGAGFETGAASFFESGPTFRCADCAAGRDEPTARLSAGAVELLRRFRTAPPAEIRAEPLAAEEVFRFHGFLVRAAAERSLPTRRALLGLLAPPSAGAEDPDAPLPRPPPDRPPDRRPIVR